MVTTVQPTNTVAFPVRRNGRNSRRPAIDQQAIMRLQLSHLLQNSLELEEVLQRFFSELNGLLDINSLCYRHDVLGDEIAQGKRSRHSCHYQLITDAERLGELSITRSKRFSDSELQLLETLIGCLVNPIRNALLYRQAVQSALQDPLTGVGNRVALDTTLKREISIAARHRQALSLLVVDLDHFKQINDNYGHGAGDCVLKDAARLLMDCCRDTDACYRYGGEEFVIVLNHTDMAGASITAERIRESLSEMSTTCGEQSIAVTASIGVATLQPGDSLQSLFNRADRAMYCAKKGGRNRVVLSSAEHVDNS